LFPKFPRGKEKVRKGKLATLPSGPGRKRKKGPGCRTCTIERKVYIATRRVKKKGKGEERPLIEKKKKKKSKETFGGGMKKKKEGLRLHLTLPRGCRKKGGEKGGVKKIKEEL